MMKAILFATCILLSLAFQVAAQQPAAMGPPKVIRIFREEIKPGKGTAHEKVEAAFARAFKRAKTPFSYLAVASMSGPSEVWFLEPHDSFAEIEEWDKGIEKNTALKSELEQLDEQDGALRSGQREILAVYREDLSYRPGVNIGQMRYFQIATIRVRPGHDMEFSDAAKMYRDARVKANSEDRYATFQAVSGAPSGTYYVFVPMKSFKEIDTAFEPKNRNAIIAAMGDDNWKKFQKLVSDSVVTSESGIYAFSPKMSNVSKEIASADPEFWTPKPKPAAKPAAAKTGQEPAAKQ